MTSLSIQMMWSMMRLPGGLAASFKRTSSLSVMLMYMGLYTDFGIFTPLSYWQVRPAWTPACAGMTILLFFLGSAGGRFSEVTAAEDDGHLNMRPGDFFPG